MITSLSFARHAWQKSIDYCTTTISLRAFNYFIPRRLKNIYLNCKVYLDIFTSFLQEVKNAHRKCTYERLLRFIYCIIDTPRGCDNESLLHLYIVCIHREQSWLTDSVSPDEKKKSKDLSGEWSNKIARDFEDWSRDFASRCRNYWSRCVSDWRTRETCEL